MSMRELGPNQAETTRKMIHHYLVRVRSVRRGPLDLQPPTPPLPPAIRQLPPDPNRPVTMKRANNQSSL